jgi:hypothetical protein
MPIVFVEQPHERTDRAGGVVVLRLAQQQRAASLEIAQVDVVAERGAYRERPCRSPPARFRFRIVPLGLRVDADLGAQPTADIGCDLVKISASGPMPTSRYCDHAP